MNILNNIINIFTIKKKLKSNKNNIIDDITDIETGIINNINENDIDIEKKLLKYNNSNKNDIDIRKKKILKNNYIDIEKGVIDTYSKAILINETRENAEIILKKNKFKKYIIYLSDHNIRLEGEIYNHFIRGVDFIIYKNNDNPVNFIIGYKYNNFDSIELFSWGKYEKCNIYEIETNEAKKCN